MNPRSSECGSGRKNRVMIVSEIPRLAPEPAAGARRTAQENEP
jgi:hypothetical protein